MKNSEKKNKKNTEKSFAGNRDQLLEKIQKAGQTIEEMFEEETGS